MKRSLIAATLLIAACGGGGTDTLDPEVPATIDAPTTDEADIPSESHAMPAELADHPLPPDAVVPFPPADLSADSDPRETLGVTIMSELEFLEVAAVIDNGLASSGYTVESSNISETAMTFWEWTKDGLPGVTTAAPNLAGAVTININLFRSGTR